MFYKTAEEAKAHGVDPVDAHGAPLEAGDIVILIRNVGSEWPVGTKATILGWSSDSSDYPTWLKFEVINNSNYQRVPRGCPATPDGYARSLPTSYFTIFVEPSKSAKDIFDEHLARVLTNQPLLAQGDQVYQLTLVPKVSTKDLFQPIITSLVDKLKATQAAYHSQVTALKEAQANLISMPDINLSMVQQGIFIWKDGGVIYWAVPFHYHPEFLADGTSTATKALSEEHKAALDKHVLAVLGITSHRIYSVELLHAIGKPFWHYQGSCLGTLHPGEINTYEDIEDFLASLEEYYRTLNTADHPNPTPPDLPTFSSLVRSAKAITNPGGKIWSVKNLSRPGQPLKVGDRVRVLRTVDHFPTDSVGSIGEIVRDAQADGRFGVSFAFKFLGGHSCYSTCPDGTGYYFPPENLERLAPTTPRTRSQGIATRTGTASTTTTTPGTTWTTIGIQPEVYDGLTIGDQVRVIGTGSRDDGTVGIFRYFTGSENFGVEFPTHSRYHHALHGHCADGHGYFYLRRNLEKVEPTEALTVGSIVINREKTLLGRVAEVSPDVFRINTISIMGLTNATPVQVDPNQYTLATREDLRDYFVVDRVHKFSDKDDMGEHCKICGVGQGAHYPRADLSRGVDTSWCPSQNQILAEVNHEH